MKVKLVKLLKDFLGENIKNTIPLYQRNYDWDRENCKAFFENIQDLLENKIDSHYIGSIVSIIEDKKRIIIDGQQRITTVNLILLVLYKIYSTDTYETTEESKKEIKKFLIERSSEKDQKEKLRLKLSENNDADFKKIFVAKEVDNFNTKGETSRIFRNFSFFYKELTKLLDKRTYKIEDLLNALKKITIIDMELEKETNDNPQLVFESLNSTGKKLEQSDLIRNFLLMDTDVETQTRYYDDYWLKIEENTSDNIKDYFRYYLNFKTSRVDIKIEDVYAKFKDFFYKEYVNRKDELLEELLKFSEYYAKIEKFNIEIELKEANQRLENIISPKCLNCGVTFPFFFHILDLFYKSIIDSAELLKILKIVESFIFRRFICEVSNNDLRSLFVILPRHMEGAMKEYNFKIEEALMYILNKNKNPTIFRFICSFEKFKFYKNKTRYTFSLYVMLNIEEYKNNGIGKNKGFLLDYIAPKTISTYWSDNLNEKEIKLIENEYSGTVGNLVLVEDKEELINKDFIARKETYKWSSALTTSVLKQEDYWNIEKIEKRSKYLSSCVEEIWKYYTTAEVDKILNNSDSSKDIISLEEINNQETDFTKERISRFYIKNKIFIFDTWKKLLLTITEEICKLDKDLFEEMILLNGNFESKISYQSNEFRIPERIRVENIDFYVETSSLTNDKINLLVELIKNLNEEEIISLYDIKFVF